MARYNFSSFNLSQFNIEVDEIVVGADLIAGNSITSTQATISLTLPVVIDLIAGDSVTETLAEIELFSPQVSLAMDSYSETLAKLDLAIVQRLIIAGNSITGSFAIAEIDTSVGLLGETITNNYAKIKLHLLEPTKIEGESITHSWLEALFYVPAVPVGTRLWLLDEDLDFVAVIDDYGYFKWHHKLREPDSFRLKLSRYHRLADNFRTGMVLLYEREGLIKGGDILRRQISINSEDGKENENWVFDGVGYGEYLKTRVAARDIRVGTGYDDKTDNAESLIKYYVDRNVVNPAVEARKIPNLVIEDDQSRGDSFRFRARFQRIDRIVKELCLNSGLGWQVVYHRDAKEFELIIVEGEEKSEVLFTPDMGNIEGIEYEESWLEFESVQFVAGQGQGSDRKVGIVTRDDYEDVIPNVICTSLTETEATADIALVI